MSACRTAITAALPVLILWLAGCASQPPVLENACLADADTRLAGQFALKAKQGDSSHQLLVVSQWKDGQLQMTGLNAVGAKLFEAQLVDGEIQADSRRLYRGPDAEHLLWGLLLHQMREQLPGCPAVDELTVDAEVAGVRLRRHNRDEFVSVAPGSFSLPARDLRVDIRRLQ